MIAVTNRKVAGFAPRWAEFRGFTLLFDNPGQSLTVQDDLVYVDCRQAAQTPELALYDALWRGLNQLDVEQLTNRFLFCPLPPSSYHVTVWDGVNEGNLTAVFPHHQPAWQAFLQQLPYATQNTPLLDLVNRSGLLNKKNWHIEFQYGRLEQWSNSSLVVRLDPANQPSADALDVLRQEREQLSLAFEQAYGVRPNKIYMPHVTLGYFANAQLAETTMPHLDAWHDHLAQETRNQTITFEQLSSYSFLDMSAFSQLRE